MKVILRSKLSLCLFILCSAGSAHSSSQVLRGVPRQGGEGAGGANQGHQPGGQICPGMRSFSSSNYSVIVCWNIVAKLSSYQLYYLDAVMFGKFAAMDSFVLDLMHVRPRYFEA